MGRGRISYMLSGSILAAFIFIMAGVESYPQSQDSASDSGSRIRENTKNAVFIMRKLASAEMAFREGSEDSEFGTEMELYSRGLIDEELAAALGCPKMIFIPERTCPGIHTPFHGYLFRLEVTSAESSGMAEFRIVGTPAVSDGEMQTGLCTYYVDQTHVIRASDEPTIEAGSQSPPLGAPQAPASCEWRNNI